MELLAQVLEIAHGILWADTFPPTGLGQTLPFPEMLLQFAKSCSSLSVQGGFFGRLILRVTKCKSIRAAHTIPDVFDLPLEAVFILTVLFKNLLQGLSQDNISLLIRLEPVGIKCFDT